MEEQLHHLQSAIHKRGQGLGSGYKRLARLVWDMLQHTWLDGGQDCECGIMNGGETGGKKGLWDAPESTAIDDWLTTSNGLGDWFVDTDS